MSSPVNGNPTPINSVTAFNQGVERWNKLRDQRVDEASNAHIFGLNAHVKLPFGLLQDTKGMESARQDSQSMADSAYNLLQQILQAESSVLVANPQKS